MLSPRTGGENLWMWVSDGMKGFILGLIGLSSGFTVASALFALIATIGVLNRLAQVTRSAKNIRWYEICYMAGGIIGNGVYLYQMPLPGGSSGNGAGRPVYRYLYGMLYRRAGGGCQYLSDPFSPDTPAPGDESSDMVGGRRKSGRRYDSFFCKIRSEREWISWTEKIIRPMWNRSLQR